MALHIEALVVPRMLPISLSFVAGFIDACTFLALFRLFVAQVTGSFVVAGAQIVDTNTNMLVATVAIPIFFMVGIGTALLLALSRWTNWIALTTALAIETTLVIAFFAIGTIGAPFAQPNAPFAVAAGFLGISAMSVQSTLVRVLMADTPSTNVMTSNTTQLAIDAAEWLIASHCKTGAHPDCVAARRRFAGLLAIMIGFLGGTICGALGYRWFGLSCVLTTVAILIVLTSYCAWRSKINHNRCLIDQATAQ